MLMEMAGSRSCGEEHSTTTGSMRKTPVRECCKGDDASQYRSPKFDPHHTQTPHAGIIKIGRGDYVVDPANVRHDSPRGFLSAHA